MLLFLLFFMTGCGFWGALSLQEAPRHSIQGTVTTPFGPLSGVTVTLSRLNGALLCRGESEADGHFEFSTSERGLFSIQATGPALSSLSSLSSLCSVVRVEDRGAIAPLSPGSTALVLVLRELGGDETLFRLLEGRMSRLRPLLDAHPYLARSASLAELESRIASFANPMAIAVRQGLPELLALAPSLAPSALQVSSLAQLIEQLPGTGAPWGELLASLKISPASVLQGVSTEPCLFWEAGSVSTLSARLFARDPGANRDSSVAETLTVRVESFFEAEELRLAETAPNSGLFGGEIPLERVYGEDGELLTKPQNGKVAVCADGGIPDSPVEAKAGGRESQTRYREPASTVTGRIEENGTPFAGAEVTLAKQGFLRKGKTRADGSYAFYALSEGTYVLTARKGERMVTEYKTVQALAER